MPDPTHAGPLTPRWTDQRWLLDNTIRSVGMDWDQPRSIYLSAPCWYVEATGRIVKTPL